MGKHEQSLQMVKQLQDYKFIDLKKPLAPQMAQAEQAYGVTSQIIEAMADGDESLVALAALIREAGR